MAHVSWGPQPQNPAAYDLHAYYGGVPGRGPEPYPGHGHLHLTHHGVQFHRPPVPQAVGQLAVRGTLPDVTRR
jgi:hypothetical protein